MNRLLVALLAAFDAVVAAAVGLAAALAPLTLLWVFGLGLTADWAGLWPTAARVWQLGHLVPLWIDLPDEYLASAALAPDAAEFAVSLAPLAFAAFTAIFASRSGLRAARAGAWITGVVAGTAAFAALGAVVWLTSGTSVAAVAAGAGIAIPALVFAVPALLGALVGAWRDGDEGPVDLLRSRSERAPLWRGVPVAVTAGSGIGVTALIGAGALLVAVTLLLRGGEVIALYESAHVDAVGVVTFSLGQLAYLPTLVVWAAAYAAGPGFAVGVGTTVSPAGTALGVVPGIPVFGALPPTLSGWMLLTVLLVVFAGVAAGLGARRRLGRDSSVATRALALAGIVVCVAGAAAVLAVCASGALGPARLAQVGPDPGAFALAVAAEAAVGAAAVLLTPSVRGRSWRPRAATAATGATRAATGGQSADTGDADRDREGDSDAEVSPR